MQNDIENLEPSEQQITEQNEDKFCPFCAERIKEAAIVCRYCNRPMPGQELNVPPIVKSSDINQNTRKYFVLFAIIGLGIVITLVFFLKNNRSGLLVQIQPTPTPTVIPTAEPCHIQAEVFIVELEKFFDDWDDANSIASSTSRISLGSAVSGLQEIRRSVTELEPPPCAEEVHDLMINYMDNVIDGYLSFMADDPDSIVSGYFDEAGDLMDEFILEFTLLKLPNIVDE